MQLTHVVLALAAALAPNAFAADASPVLATYSVNAGLVAGSFELANVTLKADGELAIVKTRYSQPRTTENLSIVVAPEVFSVLKNKIVDLSNAAIQTTVSPVVCMMMPLFGSQSVLQVARGYDYQSGAFTGGLAVVDNNAGCWLATHITLKDAYNVTLAKELEAQLQVLTVQAVAAAE